MKLNNINGKVVLIILLFLIVAVTGAFVGTLAKYATSGTVSDGADVAEFGLNVPNNVDLFSDSYTNVMSDVNGKKIIAPGTSGHYNFVVTGTSEVAYSVSANISVIYSEEWNGYEPLTFSLDGKSWTDLEDFQEKLAVALESKVMAPNETYTSTQSIYWSWPFYVSSSNDILDSEMGYLAADGTAPHVTVNIEVIAAQIG